MKRRAFLSATAGAAVPLMAMPVQVGSAVISGRTYPASARRFRMSGAYFNGTV